jgi:hypothetical protein
MMRFPFPLAAPRLWTAFAVSVALVLPVRGQEAVGDQTFSFGISQKFGATDNLRLDADSLGTTVFSDTRLSFGFTNETSLQALDFSAGGVLRLVNDPEVGVDSGFQDPNVNLSYIRENQNASLSLLATYERPDLAFTDPLLSGEITDQDFFRGGGEREDILVDARIELGRDAPLGFVLGATALRQSYFDVTDPLLVSSDTNEGFAGAIFRFDSITQARLDYFQSLYKAQDTTGTRRETRRVTLGLDRELSPVSALSLDIGESRVVETFATEPGAEDIVVGPVGSIGFVRLLPNGEASADLESSLSEDGRQTTLEFGRSIILPTRALEVSLGVANGDTFVARPVGRLSYTAETTRGAFNASLSREVTISDTFSLAEEITRANFLYSHDLSSVSSFDLELLFADISTIGEDITGAAAQRASFYASYNREVTEDWDFVVGYQYRYYNPSDGGAGRSNGVFFTLQREFERFR